MRLSVVIPSYNEESRLPSTLKKINKYLIRQDYSYEILVVNDGSKDRTREVTESFRNKIKNLTIIEYKENRGKGYAVRLGMLRAKGQYRLFTDADNSISIEQIEKFWPEFERGFDMVIGSKIIKKGAASPFQFWQRMVTTRWFHFLRKIIINLRGIEDTQCGFKCFNRKTVERIFSQSKIDGFVFDIEILMLAQRAGFKIKEVPVYWKHQSGSKLGIRAIMKMWLDLLRIGKIIE